jgi:translocator protein
MAKPSSSLNAGGPSGLRLWIGLVVFLVLCFGVNGLGGLITYPNIAVWYKNLSKPDWTPPNWVFAPVWNLIFLLTAISAWLVWRRRGVAGAWVWTFLAQLGFNLLWSVVFFGLRRPDQALIVILLLWVSVAAMVVIFWRVRPVAGLMILPYLAWVTYATPLNFALWQMNA